MCIFGQTILQRLLREECSRLIDSARRLERERFRELAWAQLDQIANLIDSLGP
jgi:hypothetical protein